MDKLILPTTDVNSEFVTVVSWLKEDQSQIQAGDLVAEVETSKASFELEASSGGILIHLVELGKEVSITSPLAGIFASREELERYQAEQESAAKRVNESPVKASKKARLLADKLGIDLTQLARGALITEKMVQEYDANKDERPSYSDLKPLPTDASGVSERIAILGSGMGATQILDILADYPERAVVCLLDDDHTKWGQELSGIPIVGPCSRVSDLFAAGEISSGIISISTSIKARTKLRKLCESASVPLSNAIDRSCKIGKDVVIGHGNVICAHCHLGTATEIGDNNFLSAYNSYDHHSKIGNDCSTGPGCMGSGMVRIGSAVRMGTGIFIQPYLEIGDQVEIASGAIILQSIQAQHAVKTKLITTKVVAINRR